MQDNQKSLNRSSNVVALAFLFGKTLVFLLLMKYKTKGEAMTLRTIIFGLLLSTCTILTLKGQTPCIANAGPDMNLCLGNGVIIGGDTMLPGQTYTWSSIAGAPVSTLSNPGSSQPIASPGTTTIYQLAINNTALACTDTDTVIVTVTQPFTVSTWLDTTICLGDSLTFDIQPNPAGPDYVYSWEATNNDDFGDASAQNPTVGPSTSGFYSVQIADTFTNCSQFVGINVTVIPLNLIASPPAEVINPGQWVQLNVFATNANGEVTYTWSPDEFINCLTCDDPEVRPENSVTYTVLGVDTLGCRGTAQVTIATDSLLIPNVFSPNGDGINDVLKLNYHGYGDYTILVFDRWGRKVFETKDTQVFWNGRDNSDQDVPEGVYYLVVKVAGDGAIPVKDKNMAFPVTLVR